MADAGHFSRVCYLLRNLIVALVLYGCLYGLLRIGQGPSLSLSKAESSNGSLRWPGATDVIISDGEESSSPELKAEIPGTSIKVTINPHANTFNRPASTVTPTDDYLGPRPHVDTIADLDYLVQQCRGTYDGLEKMRRVDDCVRILAEDESRYFSIPSEERRASQQDPRLAEYVNADGHENTLSRYVSVSGAQPVTKDSIGTCPGPIIPYHVYWTGSATWRVEAFIKSYLYTQNLPCSRLWLWLDEDKYPTAVDDMLTRDRIFHQFLPLVKRGDITVKSWIFPKRIPLPRQEDNTDGVGYFKSPGSPNSNGEFLVADGIIEDAQGQQWLQLSPTQMTFLPVAVSDAVRFVVLHIHGGLYSDMDVLMMRDMRPLLLPEQHSFAERWGAHSHPGDYNTAVMSLTANSSISSYLIRGGVRMGLNFHPRVIGRMAWKDGRNHEFKMLETAVFDPPWTEFDREREGVCTVPCLPDYGAAFQGRPNSFAGEWQAYSDGAAAAPLNEGSDTSMDTQTAYHGSRYLASRAATLHSANHHKTFYLKSAQGIGNALSDSFRPADEDEAELRKAGVVQEYLVEEDPFPPNNRTMENFYRGVWSYHIHNQWLKCPQPSSWLDVMQSAHNGFFSGSRKNVYGEHWKGPSLVRYEKWLKYA